MPKRIVDHPILGKLEDREMVTITVNGKEMKAREGEVIAAALIANDQSVFRYTAKRGTPRSIFCGIGRCTDCVMTVDGIPNIRTCVTTVKDGMTIETQKGIGQWGDQNG